MANGDILAIRIANGTESGIPASMDGCVAEIDIENLATGGTYALGMGAHNDPASAKLVLTVTSPGYDPFGDATTIQRTVYGTQWLRKPYPNQTTKNEVTVSTTLTIRVALSETIFDGDTVTAVLASGLYTQGSASGTYSGAVTNNATLTHPPVIGRWAWVGFETVTTDFLLEAVCFHGSARNGKPVACVAFTVTDENAHTYSTTVTRMTLSTRAGVGDAAVNQVQVYAATIPITSFTQGDVLTCNFVAYPWVGDAGAVLDSDTGITPPDERLCPLLLLCDKDSAYGGGVAVIDATNGHASSANTWVAANQSAAEAAYVSSTANSYTTIGYAVQAITSYNTSNLSRSNPGGGVVLLTGSHAWPGTNVGTTQGAQETYLTITRLSTVSRATAQISSGTNQKINCQRVKLYDISITGNSAGQVAGGSATTDVIWLDSCAINHTGASNTTPIYVYHLAYATRNDVTALGNGFNGSSAGSTKCPYALIRGNAGPDQSGPTGAIPISGTQYCFLGNYNLRPIFQDTGNGPTHQISDNTVVAFNTAYALSDSWAQLGSTIITHGNAYVSNLVEMLNTTPWSMEIDADGVVATNQIFWHNNLLGARIGMGFNWEIDVAAAKQHWSQRGNLLEEYGNKDDTMPTANAVRTGSWPVGYHVNCAGNHRLTFAGTPEWAGEFSGLYTVDGGTWAFVDNAAYDDGGGGDQSGNGDYHLDASADGYDLIPAGYAVLPYDLEGTARNNDGGGSAGVFEMNPPAVSSDSRVKWMRA